MAIITVGNAQVGGGGGVSSVTAADTSIVVGGTAANPTVRTGTLDVIATDHPPAADWSNNSHKITNLANGTTATDAAAFGQIPTSLPPNGAAGGDLAGTYPNPTVFQGHLTDQAAPAAPASGTLVLASFSQQGFSVPHVYDTQGNAIEITRDNMFVARNVTGSSIARGSAVYISGTTGAVPQVSLAKADSAATMPAVGLMYDTTANNGYGRVLFIGDLEKYNTSGFSAGDKLYVSATSAGALVNTAPATFPQFIGFVLASGVGNGVIYVHSSNQPAVNYGTSAGGDLTGTYPNPTIAAGAVTEAKLSLSNVTTANVSTSAHGYAPILPNDSTKFLNGVGAWTAPTASLSVLQAALTSDVALTNINQFYDGPSITLAASATYFVWSMGTFVQVTSGGTLTGKIWDGTTVYGATMHSFQANVRYPVNVLAQVTTGVSGATIKTSYAANIGGVATLKATPDINGTGATNLATQIIAIRVA